MKKLFFAWLLLWVTSAWAVDPLLSQSNISFVGKFAVSTNDPGGTCNTFNYGGYGLSFYRNGSFQKTLFMAANDQAFSCMGQVLIPSDANLKSAATAYGSLTVATTLQAPTDIASTFGGFDPGNGNPVWMLGSLVYNGKLYLGGSNSYSFNQTKAVAVFDQPDNLTAAEASNFHGFYAVTGTNVAQPRSIGGYIFLIPTTWQASFGGKPLFWGECCLSVISTTSFGPSLTAIDPADVGVTNPVPGVTYLEYPGPGPHTICRITNCEASQRVDFNLVSRVLGGGWLPGTRTVFFVEGHGTGPYCYGTAAECSNDTVMSDVKGPHAQPYRYQVLAYDANDLITAHLSGNNWDPLPYNQATPWVLSEISGTGLGEDPRGHGAALDPTTGRLYIRILDGNQPTIYVYQVTAPAGGGSSTYLPLRQ